MGALAASFALALLAAPRPAAAQRLIVSYSPGGFFTPPATQSWDVATGRLEAGTAPGLNDVGTLALGPGQTLSIPAVPPGTYVVRVRAADATGVGTASNEVVVTVP